MLKRLKQSGQCKIYACTPTMEMFGVRKEHLIPEVDDMVGAATFLNIAADADVNLFI
jgi:peroxiredoxin family protein